MNMQHKPLLIDRIKLIVSHFAPIGTRRRRLLSRVYRSLGATRLKESLDGTSQARQLEPRRLLPTMTFDQAQDLMRRSRIRPKFSIVVPVYKIAPEWLDRAISSVANQYYDNWELILVDDQSMSPALTRLMARWSAEDERIQHVELPENRGMSLSCNEGIQRAQGDFVGIMDHDDELSPDALAWFLLELNKSPHAKWLYSDECTISASGEVIRHHLKPDYAPALLMSQMYTCHMSFYQTQIARELGGYRQGFEGSQDHDFALRVAERVSRNEVIHVPRVLYGWRALESSTASSGAAKSYAAIAGLKAVNAALERRNTSGTATHHHLIGGGYKVSFQPKSNPRVSVIIPTKDGFELLNSCLTSLTSTTNYPNYEVIVIDHESTDPRVQRLLETETVAGRVRVHPYSGPFNHSLMHNQLIDTIDSELICFMNNDIDSLSTGWLEQMVGTIESDSDIGSVGGKLFFPDGTIQHGGIIVSSKYVAGHAFRFQPGDSVGYYGRLDLLTEYVGCTAALLLMRRDAFREVGGFRPERYPTSMNDVDLAIRLHLAGWRSVYNPLITAVHHESKTRHTLINHESEVEWARRMREDWGSFLEQDPFQNPNLNDRSDQFIGWREQPVNLDLPWAPANLPGSPAKAA